MRALNTFLQPVIAMSIGKLDKSIIVCTLLGQANYSTVLRFYYKTDNCHVRISRPLHGRSGRLIMYKYGRNPIPGWGKSRVLYK